jgi:hypothetical protein
MSGPVYGQHERARLADQIEAKQADADRLAWVARELRRQARELEVECRRERRELRDLTQADQKREDLIAAAALAVETIDPDELERDAQSYYPRNGSGR